MRAAVIDIGSNSLRYLDGDVTPAGLQQYQKLRETTRLAENMDATGRLSPAGIQASLAVLADFSLRAQKEGIPAYAYATSAVRDAQDGREFAQNVYEQTGIPVEILSGEQEARYALMGIPFTADGLMDIGGGSFQIACRSWIKSMPCGCVRARDFLRQQGLDQAPLARQQHAINGWMDARMPQQLPVGYRFAGVGGSITTLAALCLGLLEYDPKRLRGTAITREKLAMQLESLFEAGSQRKNHPLLAKRHDVIIPGGMVLARLMELTQAEAVLPSDGDGLEGYLMALAQKKAGCV